MSFRPPNKSPAGSRPLRTASVDSTASEKSPITTIPEESRKAPEPAALPLGDVDEVTEDSVPFYADCIVDSLIEVDLTRNKSKNSQYLDMTTPRSLRPDVNPEPLPPSRARWDVVRRHIMY